MIHLSMDPKHSIIKGLHFTCMCKRSNLQILIFINSYLKTFYCLQNVNIFKFIGKFVLIL